MLGKKLLGLLLFSAVTSTLAIGCAADPIDEEEPTGETEDQLLAGRTVSPGEVAGHLRAAGFPENMIGKMVCVAKWESTFFERARNGRHYGLFQISSLHLGEAGCPSSVSALYPARTNAKCALSVYKRQGIKAWVAYKSHKSECDRYKAPASVNGPASGADDDSSTGGGADDNLPSGADKNGADSCFSPSLGESVEENACVQSKKTGIWFQCQDEKWYRGGDADDGPFGKCSSSHPTR